MGVLAEVAHGCDDSFIVGILVQMVIPLHWSKNHTMLTHEVLPLLVVSPARRGEKPDAQISTLTFQVVDGFLDLLKGVTITIHHHFRPGRSGDLPSKVRFDSWGPASDPKANSPTSGTKLLPAEATFAEVAHREARLVVRQKLRTPSERRMERQIHESKKQAGHRREL